VVAGCDDGAVLGPTPAAYNKTLTAMFRAESGV
jgi:hypothetical protein